MSKVMICTFVGRLDYKSNEGIELIGEIADIFKLHNIDTKIIAASIRDPRDVVNAALVGADIATAPYKVIVFMFNHPLTDEGIERFSNDWKNM